MINIKCCYGICQRNQQKFILRAIQKGHLVIITIGIFNKDIKINNSLFMLSTTKHKTYQ